ncbi:allophanate hydrolase [Kribbella sp. VKM Ac-2569]|uniref:allophanate hydrolase n=1 Tax=Kribbella sp. VKM Ac-2569 TaxID=2512220 RepID=UPI0010D572EC|nr:allophanate hydrolase [Kribbella sp. VKM Ac-2569]RZT26790.1 allophanate hydrolase [Kribbella sp. VKM Ac-2569]
MNNEWITRVDPIEPVPGPLHGLTMALKDNIDLAGVPTTAGDPRTTEPAKDNAFVVDQLIAAGAVPLGKTNLDQYATGLVRTRSPYGACHSVFSPDHVSGGSSSGSAVAVATGQVDFALGTDTAGSGRVPAAFNRLVGIKPSRGLVSARGVVPACRSLDCVTVMARSVATARRVFDVMVAFDPEDAWSRRASSLPHRRPGRVAGSAAVIGVPDVGLGLDPEYEQTWQATLDEAHRLGEVVKVDVQPLLEAADLLYSGPWLAERWLAFGDKLDDSAAVDPTVRTIVRGGAALTAAGAFTGFDRLATLKRASEHLWTQLDALLLPVTPGHPTLAEVAADPIGVNSRLGRFTNMVNLLDLCAVAFPGPDRADGLPFGIQLLAPAGHDLSVIDLAALWCGEEVPPGDVDTDVLLAVAGAHLSGQPLNDQLVRRGARLAYTARTASSYRMYLVDGPRPGLTRTLSSADGPGIEVEVWSVPAAELGGFAATIDPPLAIGPLELSDGQQVLGFLCTADAADPERDITASGGWRAYLAGD